MKAQLEITKLKSDFRSYCTWDPTKPSPTIITFLRYFLLIPEFRTVVYYRIGYLSLLISWLFRPQKCCYLNARIIGGGLHIQHGFASIVSARSIGKNFHVHQQVTVGWTSKGCPVIGDDVRVNAGAIVIGGITIGNDVEIGAGAVVTKDIPDHSMVVGVPAKIIKRRKSVSDKWE